MWRVCMCLWCICRVCVCHMRHVCVFTAHVWRSVDICRSWFFLPPQRSWELHAVSQAYNISPVLSKASRFLFLIELIFINMLKRPPLLSSPFSLTMRPVMLNLFLWAWAGRKLGVWLHTRQPQGPLWHVVFVLHTLWPFLILTFTAFPTRHNFVTTYLSLLFSFIICDVCLCLGHWIFMAKDWICVTEFSSDPSAMTWDKRLVSQRPLHHTIKLRTHWRITKPLPAKMAFLNDKKC